MGLDVPIVNAPMGGVSGGELAAAVSRAGGLGMIGMGSTGSPARLHEELAHVAGLERPFGIGLVGWVVAKNPNLLTTALAAQPAILAVSFTQEWSWVRHVHDAGGVAAAQVANLEGAQRAVDAGVDVVVTRGSEGGGHGEPSVGTLPLLTAALDRLSAPVLAAGGISSARGLAAVLAAGASGAWLGTCLSACPEALTSEPTRQALLAAHDTDTVTTRVFDVAQRYPWPPTLPERTLRNEFTDRWYGRENELATDSDAHHALEAAVGADDHRLAPVNAGQGVGALTAALPAAELIDQMCTGAAQLLGQWASVIPPVT